MSKFDRRLFLTGAAATLGGCLLPQRRPPQIPEQTPLGPIGRRQESALMVGAAKIDVTPPPGMPIWLGGFGFQRKMREVRDPIFAHAIVLDNGRRRIGLVVADMIGLMQPTIDRVRRMVGRSIDLAVISTHNHQSPDTIGFWGPAILFAVPHQSGINPTYLSGLERRMAIAVARAARSARPAELRAAAGRVPPGVSKNIRPPFIAPDDLLVVQAVERDSGSTIATLVDFACHVETLGARNQKLSADFPGVLRSHLDDILGGVTIFANGSLGGMITPDISDNAEADERSAMVTHVGMTMAQATQDALSSAKIIDPHPLGYLRREVDLKPQNELFKWLDYLGLVEQRRRGKRGFLTEVGRFDIGPISFALLPGEPSPRTGAAAMAHLRSIGAEFPAVIGLANDELGYLLEPATEFDDPAFSYEVSMSVGRETAPDLLAALASLPARRK